jgi:hypothetical protein
MFAKTIVLSDAFLDMPLSTRCLYFTLGMLADDDGFINSPKSIMRQCGASIDDLNLLVAKKFIIPFENGVVVIKHWRIHNYIQKDRYKGTKYIEEKNSLAIDKKGAYTTKKDDVSILDTQDRIELGKDKLELGKDNTKAAENPLDVLPEDVRSAFEDFAKMRKTKLKKPMTENAISRMIHKLISLSTDESIQIAILNQSEDNCWLDLYPLKSKPNQAKSSNPFLDMVEEGVFDD